MQQSKIEWTNSSWNPVTGCDKVSAGCKNCYAETMHKRFAQNMGPFNTITCHEDRLMQPFKLKGKQRVFVNSMSDLFHDDVPYAFLVKVFAVMAHNPHITFQVLTKRPERALYFLIDPKTVIAVKDVEIPGISTKKLQWPLPNVWLGVSTENQTLANERIQLLLSTPAAVRFISAEPLLSEIDLTMIHTGNGNYYNALAGNWKFINDDTNLPEFKGGIDWVIAGGESGTHARPCHPMWLQSLQTHCQLHKVPFFFKQWGAYHPGRNPKKRGVLIDHTGKINDDFGVMMSRGASHNLLNGKQYMEYPESIVNG